MQAASGRMLDAQLTYETSSSNIQRCERREPTELRLTAIKRRQADLAAEAAASRLVARRRVDAGAGFSGLRLRLGSVLIVVGRKLCEEDALKAGLVRR